MLALKARPETAGIPIIIVTARDLSAGERAALNGQVRLVLEKAGLERAEFLNEVRRAMQKRGKKRLTPYSENHQVTGTG